MYTKCLRVGASCSVQQLLSTPLPCCPATGAQKSINVPRQTGVTIAHALAFYPNKSITLVYWRREYRLFLSLSEIENLNKLFKRRGAPGNGNNNKIRPAKWSSHGAQTASVPRRILCGLHLSGCK